MSFVRKPRPYSSGLPDLNLPAPSPSPRPARLPRPPITGGRSAWATAVTALAVLGTVVVLLVGLTGLAEQLWKDAQFRAAAAGVAQVHSAIQSAVPPESQSPSGRP